MSTKKTMIEHLTDIETKKLAHEHRLARARELLEECGYVLMPNTDQFANLTPAEVRKLAHEILGQACGRAARRTWLLAPPE